MRCRYCMPEDEYVWLPRQSILTFEEIDRVAGVFAGLGVSKIRLTGGEPLLRHDLPTLVALLARHAAELSDLALTTNGILLARHAAALAEAGLRRVTVSLDTLRPERMHPLRPQRAARRGAGGHRCGTRRPSGRVKLNTVVIRGYNDDEVLDLLEFARARGVEPRFIEYMDVGGATGWSVRPGGLPARDPRAWSRAGTDRFATLESSGVGAGRAVRAAGRDACSA